MKTKILLIAIVRKGNKVLLRKKPKGSSPYRETWYLFGAELSSNKNPEKILQETLKKQAGINIKLVENLGWDIEIKKDYDNIKKLFVYLDTLCKYVSGKPTPSKGIERLEWIPISRLSDYDLVPPSKKLFKKIGYL